MYVVLIVEYFVTLASHLRVCVSLACP